MFPHPNQFCPAADVVIAAVALITKFYRNDHTLTRRWRSPTSPGVRSAAWVRRMEYVQHLRVRIESRIDMTELASNGCDDGLPSRQRARLRGMRDAAKESANTLRRILSHPRYKLRNREDLWDLVDNLESAADTLDALAYGELYARA